MIDQAQPRPRPWWVVPALIILPVTMATLAFWGMPAFYSLYCKLTGTQMAPNSSTNSVAVAQPTGRYVEVFFEAKVFDGLTVRFVPAKHSLTAEVGVEAVTSYTITNLSDQVVHTRPIHQVSPNAASLEFGMRLCFCFTDLVLQPHEERVMPLAFTFGPKLDERVGSVSVCYSLFNVAPGTPKSEAQLRIQREIEAQGGVVTPGFRVMSAAEIEELRKSEATSGGTPSEPK